MKTEYENFIAYVTALVQTLVESEEFKDKILGEDHLSLSYNSHDDMTERYFYDLLIGDWKKDDPEEILNNLIVDWKAREIKIITEMGELILIDIVDAENLIFSERREGEPFNNGFEIKNGKNKLNKIYEENKSCYFG